MGMDIDDMSTDTIKKYLEKRELEEEKTAFENLSVEEQIMQYPERFERLAEGGKEWQNLSSHWSISELEDVEIENDEWNHIPNKDNVYLILIGDSFKELIRRVE